MVEGASPPGGSRGPGTISCRPVRFRITLDRVGHLSAVHQAHLCAVGLLADSPLKIRLSERLEISQAELGLLGRRLRSNDQTQQYRLEDIFESVRTSLNSVREELLEAVHSTLGQKIPELVPEAISEPPPAGINEEALASTASVPPPAPPPPIEIAPAPLAAEPIPAPVAIAVSEAGVVPAPRKPLLESDEYLAWQQSLKPEQAIGLGFVEGLEGGRLIERIFKTQELMIYRDIYGAALIDLVLDAVYKLRQRKIPGLDVLLARLPELDGRARARETVEVRGAAVEIIRLGYIAEEETSDPLTEAGRKFKNIVFYPMRRLAGEGGVRYAPEREKRLTEDADADGYRGSSRTLIEIKYSSQPLTLNGDGNGQVLRLLNQGRKYGVLIRKGVINQVDFIIIAPEIDPEIIKLIYGMVYGSFFHFTDITSREGKLYPLLNPKLMPGKIVEVKDKSHPKDKDEWDEAAWVWALGKYTGEAGKFKGFDNDPRNLRKDVRQPQTSAVLYGLQGDLDKAFNSIPDKLAQARSDEESAKIEELRANVPILKRRLAEWRRKLNTNSLGTSTICEFSHVLQEIRELLG